MDRKLLGELSKRLTDQGKLIEAGWVGCRIAWVPKDAPEVQIVEMRRAYMAGAQHLFASIMGILDPGAEPTEKDLQRMQLIHEELEAFRRSLGN
jgi:hypothetical protein